MSTLVEDQFEELLREIARTHQETVATRRELASVQRELAAVRAAIEGADVRVDPTPTVKDQLMTRKHAARHVGKHPTTLDRWAKKHPYLCVQDGNGRRRYSKMMLDDFGIGRV